MESVLELTQARGQVFDWVRGPVNRPDIGPESDWIITGEWTLDCNAECVVADLGEIKFGMALAMLQPGGDESHSHQLNGFLAKSVEHITSGPGNILAGDSLTIKGEINVELGRFDIVLELVGIGIGRESFFFTLSPPAPWQDRAGGVITESR